MTGPVEILLGVVVFLLLSLALERWSKRHREEGAAMALDKQKLTDAAMALGSPADVVARFEALEKQMQVVSEKAGAPKFAPRLPRSTRPPLDG